MAVNKQTIDYTLYLVTDRDILRGRDFTACVAEALAGGASLLQLREKDLNSRDFYTAALALKDLCRQFQVPLIINDRLDIMLAIDADGLHIGQNDIPLEVARRIIGAEKILGYSVSKIQEAVAGADLADYLGAGTVFPTSSKDDTGTPIGIDGLQAIKSVSALPVVAIGGINMENLADIKAAGADGAAVISAILGREDIQQASRDFLQMWKKSPAGKI